MALGKRRQERQLKGFVVASDLPKSPGHPFYTALNRLLAENDFDRFVEKKPRFHRGCSSGRCSLATSRASSRTAVSVGGALTADRWLRSWALAPRTRFPITRR